MKYIVLGIGIVLLMANVVFAGSIEERLRDYQINGDDIVQYMSKKSLSQNQQNKIVDAVIQHQQEGIPSEPLVDKVNEGLAKNVAAERIVRALAKVAGRYEHIADLVEPLKLKDKERAVVVRNFAHAVASGLSKSDAEEILTEMGRKSLDDKVAGDISAMVKTVSRMGVSSVDVTRLATSSVKNGMSSSEVQSIQQAFKSAGKYGDPDTLAKNYASGIEKGLRNSELNQSVNGTGDISTGNKQNEHSGEISGSSGGSGSGGNGGNGGGNGKH